MEGNVRAGAVLLDLIDEAYDKTSWHGPNLRGALRGVKESEVDWRPAPGRHSIRELVVHAAYWKYRVRRRLAGDTDAAFDLAGSNWFVKEPGRTWARELMILATQHQQLRTVVAAIPDARLNRAVGGGQATAAHLIRGIAAHDLYHAGQIQMLKRTVRSR
jgi:uncharacterized damage-inducible protein DinB